MKLDLSCFSTPETQTTLDPGFYNLKGVFIVFIECKSPYEMLNYSSIRTQNLTLKNITIKSCKQEAEIHFKILFYIIIIFSVLEIQ